MIHEPSNRVEAGGAVRLMQGADYLSAFGSPIKRKEHEYVFDQTELL